MKILKCGKVEQRKFACSACGCVFVADRADMSLMERVACPQERCTESVRWETGEPYEEPTKDDSRLKLIFLIKNFRASNLETADCEADFLIANGVRVEEDTDE